LEIRQVEEHQYVGDMIVYIHSIGIGISFCLQLRPLQSARHMVNMVHSSFKCLVTILKPREDSYCAAKNLDHEWNLDGLLTIILLINTHGISPQPPWVESVPKSPQSMMQVFRDKQMRAVRAIVNREAQDRCAPYVRDGFVSPFQVFEAGLMEGETKRCVGIHGGLDDCYSYFCRLLKRSVDMAGRLSDIHVELRRVWELEQPM
jgi:hypothetical protein